MRAAIEAFRVMSERQLGQNMFHGGEICVEGLVLGLLSAIKTRKYYAANSAPNAPRFYPQRRAGAW